MAFRDLVTGGAGCSVSGEGSSSANPLGSLANSLLGNAAKTKERVQELPSLSRPGQAYPGLSLDGPLQGIPGSEMGPGPLNLPPLEARRFLEEVQGEGPSFGGFEDAWGEAAHTAPGMHGPLPHLMGRGMPGVYRGSEMGRPGMVSGDAGEAAHFEEFERIYGAPQAEPIMHGPEMSDPALSSAIRSFFDISRGGAPFMPHQHQQMPTMPLAEGDAMRLRNRSSILARHVFADQGEGFADAQVDVFLRSLGVQPGPLAHHALDGTAGGRFREFEGLWNEARQAKGVPARNGGAAPWGSRAGDEGVGMGMGGGGADAWAQEFEKGLVLDQGPDALPGTAWANEFGQEMATHAAHASLGGQPAARQAQRLANALARDADPKFQNSKFLDFVSKMGRGEVAVEGGVLKTGVRGNADQWAEEFESQNGVGMGRQVDQWAGEFDALHHNQRERGAGDQWADEFQAGESGALPQQRDWADEFGDQMARGFEEDGIEDASGWLDSYNRYVEDQLQGEIDLKEKRGSARWSYTFSDQNPYVGHPNPFEQGRQLFEKGLLSEAVLALEAEVLKNDSNSDAWHLLGRTHAENDDDRQAIAAMTRAKEANPANLSALLALGVSHTNELEQAEALAHLRSWLQHNPNYSALLPQTPEGAPTPQLSHGDIVSLFTEASRLHPNDPDLQEVLGVLFNLSREFGRAKEAFEKALALRPDSYVLWNRMGATQANNAESAPAIAAYQKALDIKPNYVRAWTNMGIAFANQGKYEESIRFYVRALSMNPTAENAWQYLRIALSGANRQDAWGLSDRHDIDALQKEFPL